MNYQEHAINRNWSADGKIDLYRQVMRIRRFEAMKARDPLEMWGRHLVEQGMVDEPGLLEISDQARTEAILASQFAESGSAPAVSDIGKDVYWETDHASEVSRIGCHFFDD